MRSARTVIHASVQSRMPSSASSLPSLHGWPADWSRMSLR